ncbi:MAG TPA: hypothetical protein VGQ36_00160 [Thermoanaerobaculia bacterium]|jgi:hypothetical protein|nr:hypothetical protein [Thermoanaerobaculia bacterium]
MRKPNRVLVAVILIVLIPSYAVPQERRPAVVRSDNYLDIRAKQVESLERTRREREQRRRHKGVVYEDLQELEFERWDRYGRDHLDAASREPGKMADMSRHLRQWHEASSKRRVGDMTMSMSTAAAAPPVCPSAGLGNWVSAGPSTYPAPIIGKITSVQHDSNSTNTFYAGSAGGGLFKTVNNGASWTNLTDPSRYPALGITTMAVHPSIPTTIYIGTRNGAAFGGTYGFGVLRTIDGGATWQEIFTLANYNSQSNYNVGDGQFVSKVLLHPQDPNTVYVLASHFIFRSTDAGATWQEVLEIQIPAVNPDGCGYRLVDIDVVNGNSGVSDSAIMASTVRTAWLGIPNSPCGTAKSFLSTDGGSTFTEVTAAIVANDAVDRIAAAVQPGNTSEFFIGYGIMNGAFVLKRYSIGNNIATLVGAEPNNSVWGLGAGFWNIEIDFSKINPNTLYAAGTTAYRISLATGFTSAQISSYWATSPSTCVPLAQTHADIRAMQVSRIGTSDAVILGSDGGIHEALLNPATAYTPTTANWDDLTGPGMAINEFFDINGMESNPNVLVGGTQDNGTFEYNNGIWRQRLNYDGWQGTINEATGEYYGMSNAGAMKGLIGTAGTYAFASTPAIGGGPVVSDPNNPATIYAGGANLFRSTNFGTTWTTVTMLAGTANVHAIRVAPSNSNVIYVTRSNPTWNPNNLSGRVYRSTDSGTTWTDIGVNNLGPLTWATAVDIAIDPDDANRLWLSFNGYWPTSNTSIAGANRVWYSADGGNTWSDFTYNLLAFPVLTLVYQRGSDDVLYAGTDVGVFRFNKALQQWECFSNMLPIVPLTRLEINYCKNKIRASTFGRGVYESDLPALPAEKVSASTTWSGVRRLSNDLTIASGATLTITGALHMSRNTRINVERGATLHVNGGTITNLCGDLWHGIYVWGTASVAQNVAGAQGRVIVQNNARIENAMEAITTGREVNGTFDWSYTGGIVQASNSIFANNRRSVQFMYYHSMIGPNEVNNLSSFRNCTFETTRLLNDPTVLPYAHLSLYEVKNVLILGCRFRNSAAASVFGPNQRGDGIVSADASYYLDDLYNTILPPSVIASSEFSGLTYGVRAGFTPTMNKKITMRNSDFTNVQRGVEVNRSNGSIVDGNTFTALPNAMTANYSDATWGVRMNNASALTVSFNTITGASAAYSNSYGIIIDNCGNFATNLVRGNALKDLYTGILADGNNGSGPNGVQFRCNIFQPAMAYQLSVAPMQPGALADQGTLCIFGSTADNTFFPQATPPGSQIYSPNASFQYFASGTVPTNMSSGVTIANCGGVAGECVFDPWAQ